MKAPAFLALSSTAFGKLRESDVSVGAIRWDAWFGAPEDHHFGVVGRAVHEDLSPQEYHYRLPFFAKKFDQPDPVTNYTVLIDGNSTDVMAQEIRYAADFGIDFWAFCAYPLQCKDYNPDDSECTNIQCCADNVALGYALERYLEQPAEIANLVKFSLILQPGYWYPSHAGGGTESVEEEAARFVSYFQKDNYQKVLGGRPVVYIFGHNDDVSEELSLLRNMSVAAGAGNPYIVVMAGSAKGAWNHAQQLGADAISSYVVNKNPKSDAGYPYAEGIAKPEEQFWEDAKSIGAPLIPPITAGWDNRPRQHIDLPWNPNSRRCPEQVGHDCYVQDPTMDELANHTRDALAFALENPSVVESGAALINAWNENDEGHWIVPSLNDGTAKLEAVQRGIQAALSQAAAEAHVV